jgi:hypothetical protein
MPGICWYPAKGTGQTVKQGGTADKEILFVLDRERISVGDFLFSPLAERQRRFFYLEGIP